MQLCLFYTFESIYLKAIHYGQKFKANLSHDMCYLLGLYFNSSYMWQFTTYFTYGKILEYIGILQPVLPWLVKVTNGIEYCLIFRIRNLESGFCSQPKIDVYSQPKNYYNVLSIDHTRLCFSLVLLFLVKYYQLFYMRCYPPSNTTTFSLIPFFGNKKLECILWSQHDCAIRFWLVGLQRRRIINSDICINIIFNMKDNIH